MRGENNQQIQNKMLIDDLTLDTADERYNWKAIMIDIFIYVSLRFLQGNVGLLSNIQTYLWIDVAQVHTRCDVSLAYISFLPYYSYCLLSPSLQHVKFL